MAEPLVRSLPVITFNRAPTPAKRNTGLTAEASISEINNSLFMVAIFN